MADVFTWTLTEIRAHWRELTGRSTTGAISDTDVNKWINDYYVNYFAEDANVDDLNDFNTFTTAPTDTGEYDLAQGVLKIDDPITVNGNMIEFYADAQLFFERHPDDEQYITDPGIAIGSVDPIKVLHDAFSYNIAGNAYSKATSEVAFSGLSTVPQHLYGAFSLTIDADGDITINEAGANSTGYATPALAINALEAADSDSAYMGYVTVVSTDAGGFVPGTTALDDAAVTDTYTDGQPKNHNQPTAAVRYADKLYLRPRPDDIYRVKYPYIKRPDALEAADAPLDAKWGTMIALGAAILFLATKGEQERVVELTGAPVSLSDFRSKSIARKKRKQNQRRYNRVSY
ncbi:MAG: hypothetical protein JRE40_12000 [Deltaproteobacteria bacterium]|nr:hypothetical protein [Deltaproteobacteria bacterium]